MKWFDNWLYSAIKRVHETQEKEREEEIYSNRPVAKSTHRGLVIPTSLKSKQHGQHVEFNTHPLHFKVYRATGGHIVEYQYYNEKTDRHDQALHLISSDKDLGSELAKIMTLESLRR